MEKTRRNNLIKLGLVIIPVAVLFYVMNWLTPIAYDDHTYAFSFDYNTGKQRITSLLQIPTSMYYHYFTMNGRLVTHFLAQLFLMFGKSVFNVINTFAYILLGMVMYIHAYGSMKKVRTLPLLFIYTALFLFSPAFAASFLWLTGSANYMYGPLLALLFLLPYRLSYAKPQMRENNCIKTIVYTIGMFLFGVIAGNTNENNAVTLVAVTSLFVCYRWIRYKQLPPWMVAGAVGVLVGCLAVLLSPGTAERAVGKDMSILATVKRAAVNTVFAMEKHGIFLVILAVLLCICYSGMVSVGKPGGIKENAVEFLKKNHIFAAYFFLFGLSFYAMSPVPYFVERAWTVHLIYLIIATAALYGEAENYLLPHIRKFAACAISAALILHACSVYLVAYKGLEEAMQQYDYRMMLIQEAKSSGEQTVTIPAISTECKYSVYVGSGDIKADHTHWTNAQIAKYYGLDTVYLEQNETSVEE